MDLGGGFDRERHVFFLQMMADGLPAEYQTQEVNHLTLAYFAVSGLALLDALDREFCQRLHQQVHGSASCRVWLVSVRRRFLDHPSKFRTVLVDDSGGCTRILNDAVDKEHVASWVLSFQAFPRDKTDLNDGQFYGFHGSKTSQFTNDNKVSSHNGSHLASTYCALAILKTVGYDLSSIDPETISASMRNLQQCDGSFMPTHIGAEKDLRFLYCAAAICFMLNNWSGMDREKAKEYILQCQSYDGGFGLVPGSESHGGATYCAVAALRLMGFIEADVLSKSTRSSVIDIPLLVEWSLQRQGLDGGFQGRANKPSDTCYAFWIGSVLKILGAYHLVDKCALRRFLLSCQSQYGGITKFAEDMLPELYHSYFGFSALSLLEEPGMKPLCVELGVVVSNDVAL